VSYTYKATQKFWKNKNALPENQQKVLKKKFELFKEDPFHPLLRSHTIAKLAADYRHPIFSAVIEGNLRVLFRIDGNVVTTLTVGTHDLYR
jgi:mRNA-degrading endonuclease RelE of RelBE toxin-antitoxin system